MNLKQHIHRTILHYCNVATHSTVWYMYVAYRAETTASILGGGGGYTNTRLCYAQQISFKINLILKEIRWEEHNSMNAPSTLVHFPLKTFSLIRCNTV